MIYWRTVTLMMLPVTTFCLFSCKTSRFLCDLSLFKQMCNSMESIFLNWSILLFPDPTTWKKCLYVYHCIKRFTWTWWLQCWEKNRLILKGINHIWFFSQRQKFISLCYAAVITCFIFFSSQEYVSDLFHYLHNSSESPQLIALLESFLFSVVRDVKHYSSENQRLEEALKRYSRL